MKTLRSKWFLLNLSLDASDIAEKLIDNSFNEDSNLGYEVNHLTDSNIQARYIEKYTYEESVIDPYGEAEIIKSQRYKCFDFELIKATNSDRYFLRIENSPKSISNFLNDFNELMDFEFFIQPIKLDIMSIVNLLKDKRELTQLKINKVKISGLILEKDSVSKVEVVSEHDAFESLHNHFHPRNYELDNIKCSFRYNMHYYDVEFRKSGGVVHSSDISELLLDVIQNHKVFN